MKRIRFTLPVSICLLFLLSIPSFAVIGRRGTSNNGVDSSAPFWNLFGPTAQARTDGGKVSIRTQVVCTNQQVASAVDAQAELNDPANAPFADAGSCADGAYTYLYQIQSAVQNLTVVINGLVGFTPVSNDSTSTYGVETCDSAQNTLELCSNVAGATTANLNLLDKIKTVVNNNNTGVHFIIPKVPGFPAGSASQGRGLTLVILLQQAPGVPVHAPVIQFQ